MRLFSKYIYDKYEKINILIYNQYLKQLSANYYRYLTNMDKLKIVKKDGHS